MRGGSRGDVSSRLSLIISAIIMVVLASPLAYSESDFNGDSNRPRNCLNTWSVGDSDNITTSEGTFAATVEKVSSNSAIFVEEDQVVSSTTLNDIVSTWESIIFPTTTNYFGGVPDIDDNCQIEIVIVSIDGPNGEAGYFETGLSTVRESILIDIDDLASRNRVLSQELGQLIHHNFDPFEYLWIDEGMSEMAGFLNFGTSPNLEGYVNSWTENTSKSLRWWDGRGEDRGSSFLFMSYLVDKLGGAPSARQFISDGSLGGNGIESLARNPGPGSTIVGTTMSEIFANFSAAVTLDSDQGAFGFSNLDLFEDCNSGGFCSAPASAENDDWADVWQSAGHSIEGWGLRSFRFSGGDGSPLSILVQPDRFGFEGVVMKKESSSGIWSMEKLRIDPENGFGTGLVHGFGNSSSEVWLLVWYNSLVDDCDYDFANCGVLSSGSYPQGSFSVSASIVSSPADASIESIEVFDRDGDSLSDSVEIEISVSSSAYFEILSVEFSAYINNSQFDTSEFMISAGDGAPGLKSIWFTPPFSGEWSFTARISDITGEMQDIAQSLPQQLSNMKPVGSGSTTSNETQTWLPVYFFGGGYDSWGFGSQNGTYGYNDTPSTYIWDLGDGNSSSLKNPVHNYAEKGVYVISLIVRDGGGFFSEAISWNISVNDSSAPIPQIAIDGLAIGEELTLQTNQRVQFSSFGTIDNVPISKLFFSWDWGDGAIDSGIGLFEIGHSWADGSGSGTVYSLELFVSDGSQSSVKTVLVKVINRAPRQIFSENLQAYAVTPIPMPDVFVDDDGVIVEHRWTFDEGVNLDGQDVSLISDFSSTSSFEVNPIVAWREPGRKNITLEVTDDDGNSSIGFLEIEIINQRPVALFERPDDGKIGEAYVFSSSSFDPDGDSSELGHFWTFSDREGAIENTTSVSRTFSEPGLYSVSLVVIDERGLDSAPKTYLLSIENPLPVPIISFSCPSDKDGIMDRMPNELDQNPTWKVPWTSSGGAFVAPGDMIRFDGSESYDADPTFEGKSSTDINDQDWTGIADWIWDFGDASPSLTGPTVWHSYDRPGEYTVRLTVVDGFGGGGDSNTTEMKILVSEAPQITTIRPINSDYAIVGEQVNLSIEAFDPDLDNGIVAWIDEDAGFDSDGDGDPRNDKDRNLSSSLEVDWDLNVFLDDDCKTVFGCDGDSRNDWILPNQTWSTPGEIRISVRVCDGIGVCNYEDYVVTVLSLKDTAPPKTLADLTLEDLAPGKESSGLLFLVTLVAILGWMIMRDRDDDELDAIGMAKKYDVDEVEAEGGLPGMDQHTPPPQPKYLTTDERTNKGSGYVRPIRTRRR